MILQFADVANMSDIASLALESRHMEQPVLQILEAFHLALGLGYLLGTQLAARR